MILLYVVFVERRPLASIGPRRRRVPDILIAVLAGVALFASVPIIYFVVSPCFI